jgi:hypothetical protein
MITVRSAETVNYTTKIFLPHFEKKTLFCIVWELYAWENIRT